MADIRTLLKADAELSKEDEYEILDKLAVARGLILRGSVSGRKPIVYTVLRWNAARQEACPRGRADGRCAEKVLETRAGFSETVQARGPDLAVPTAPKCPRPLVIRQYEKDIRSLQDPALFSGVFNPILPRID